MGAIISLTPYVLVLRCLSKERLILKQAFYISNAMTTGSVFQRNNKAILYAIFRKGKILLKYLTVQFDLYLKWGHRFLSFFPLLLFALFPNLPFIFPIFSHSLLSITFSCVQLYSYSYNGRPLNISPHIFLDCGY